MLGLEHPRRRDDRDAGAKADHQAPAAAGGHGHPAPDRVRGGEQRTGVVQQLSTRIGQRDAVAVPGEQGSAEILFQRADLPTECWLGDVQLIGGAAEVQPVGDGDEIAQLAQVQIHGASPVRQCLEGITAAETGLGHTFRPVASFIGPRELDTRIRAQHLIARPRTG
jgi:hypothetical protein